MPILFRYCTFLLLIAFVAGCSTPQSIMVLELGGYDTSQIPDSLKEGADVVTRHYQRDISFQSSSEATTTVRFAVTVFNSDGRDHGQLVLPYDKFRSIEYVHGTLRDRNGNIVRVLEKDEERDFTATSSFSLYDDNRIKVFELYHSSYPYTLEYEYQIKHNGLTGFPNMRAQVFREGVERAEFNVSYPLSLKIHHLVENSNPSITKDIVQGRKKVQFIFKNLTPMEHERFGPPSSTYLPQVSISPNKFRIENTEGSLASWGAFGKWYYELSKGKRILPEKVKREVDQLIKGIEDERTKLKYLYNYLQDKTRYVSIQLGLGGWEPFNASYVAKNEYGDCKALTNFMMALAEYAGIETYPVLINSGSDSQFEVDPQFPSNSFNHIVLMAPMGQDTLWMECTSKTMAFGDIGLSNEKRYALAVTPEGGQLVKTPAKPYVENQQLNTAQLTIEKSGTATGSITTVYTGNQQQDIRQNLVMSNDTDRIRWLKNSLNLNSAKLGDINFSDPGKRSNRYKLSYEVEAPDFATETSSRLFIPVNALNRWDLQLPNIKERKTDLYLPFTYADSDTTIMKIPEGYQIESIPELPKIKSKYVEYRAELTKQDKQTLIYRRYIALKKSQIPREEYNTVSSLFGEMYKSDRQNIVITQSD